MVWWSKNCRVPTPREICRVQCGSFGGEMSDLWIGCFVSGGVDVAGGVLVAVVTFEPGER